MKLTKALVQKYEAGACTTEEKAFVEQWLQAVELSEEEHASLPSEPSLALEEELWRLIQPATKPHSRKINYRRYISIAAMLTLVGFISFYVIHLKESQRLEQASLASLQTIKAKKGERLSFTLGDGTQVWLNSESELSFPKQFANNSRRLHLRGEATFKVTKDPYRPFSIQAGGTLTRVLGTVFNLKAYPGEPVYLAVEEGKVSFGKLADSLENLSYTAGQQITYMLNGKLSPIQRAGADDFAWRKNKLIFHGEQLEEVAQMLNRWYGVEITLASTINRNAQFTGEFDHAKLDYVLERMAYVLKIQVRKEADKIILY